MRGMRRGPSDDDGFGVVVFVLFVGMVVGGGWLLENIPTAVFDVIPLLMIGLLVFVIIQLNQLWRTA